MQPDGKSSSDTRHAMVANIYKMLAEERLGYSVEDVPVGSGDSLDALLSKLLELLVAPAGICHT